MAENSTLCCLPHNFMTRTFVALELNSDVQSHLSEIIARMASALPRLRWVDPSGIHLTLAFLGELTNPQVEQVIEATQITAQSVTPFSYRLSHLGTFGSAHPPRSPQVIWAGIDEPSGRLSQLHHNLNRELQARGFEVDTRPFSPHLTLSRIKQLLKPDELHVLQKLLTNKQFSSTPYPVHHLSVMKSVLSRSGATYTSLQDCPLGS